MAKLFVIAIGGTGMRCLESFVHLCAIGMFDNHEVDILTLDTDQSNGNKGRVEELINIYNKVKSNDENRVDGGTVNRDTFFSAKLNLYKFYTSYGDQNRKSFKVLSHTSNADAKSENRDLSDLFYDESSVQEFELDHGYRAQTHLGSMLMYHGIIEAARNAKEKGENAEKQDRALKKFIELLQNSQNSARVFVFGSIFGGTGASSIPVIPVALRDAVSILSDGAQTLDLANVKFGATLLTNYFSFNSPSDLQKRSEKVIADSNNFALNSQAALQFYQGDPTVRATYKCFYHIGWPFAKLDVSNPGETTTGGQEQKNACHVVELLCACAAYDFFTLDDRDERLTKDTATYYYRSVEEADGVLTFKGQDFLTNGLLFENKLGAFFTFAHMVLSQCEAAWADEAIETVGAHGFVYRFKKQNIHDYDGITIQQAKEINDYLRMFGYKFDKSDNMVKGWMYQIYDSVKPGVFLFREDAFKEKRSEMKSISCGQLFIDPRHNWSEMTGMFSKSDNSIDVLIKTMLDPRSFPKAADQQVNTTKEKFLAHIYNAITLNQKFEI